MRPAIINQIDRDGYGEESSLGYIGLWNSQFMQFADTLSAIEEIGFDSIYAFIYSKRNGTPAKDMEDPITPKEKSARFSRLLEIESKVNAELGEKLLGKTMRILVDSAPDTEGNCTGRNSGNKIIRFTSKDNLEGQFVNVKITNVSGATVFADII